MIRLAIADLPVAAVHCTSRGKVLGLTALASDLLEAEPVLMAEIVSLVLRTGGRGGSSEVTPRQGGSPRLRLVAVQERNDDAPGACVVFLLRHGESIASTTDRLSALTPREREVAQLAMTGLRSWEIAERLACRERTVRAHLQATYLKLGVKGRVELTRLLTRPP